jgi:rhamnosyltransferase
MKSVSVILSTYNGEKYIAHLLDSLLQQTGVNISLFVIDDCSSDSTVSIVMKYKSDFSSFYFKQNSHTLGLVSNQLTMLRMIDSEYIAFADQDDVWLSDKLERAIHKLSNNSADFYSSAATILGTNRKIRKSTYNFPAYFFRNSTMGCTLVFSKTFKDEFLRLDSSRIIQLDWAMNIFAKSNFRCVHDPESRLLYRIHPTNQIGHPKLTIRFQLFFKTAAHLQIISSILAQSQTLLNSCTKPNSKRLAKELDRPIILILRNFSANLTPVLIRLLILRVKLLLR